MADFYQSGVVATLHRLKPGGATRMENELREMADRISIELVLPALYSEFESPAMRRIANELAEIPYLRHIVVAVRVKKSGPEPDFPPLGVLDEAGKSGQADLVVS